MKVGAVPARIGRALDIARSDGGRELARRVGSAAVRRLGEGSVGDTLPPSDVADSRTIAAPVGPRIRRERPLVVGWVTTPPGPGSGGHTTMFRMIEAVERAGHTCVVLLYDRFGGDVRQQQAVIRAGWPTVRAEIRTLDRGFSGLDACVATAWSTAHVLARRCRVPMRYLYLVQDYEPFFYPRGSDYALAEDSYRFGFRCVAIGRMVADLLASEVGVDAAVAEFGCDTEVYRLTNTGDRFGVACYVRLGVPRRGATLALSALEQFHARHPDQPIHLFGDRVRHCPLPAVQHGTLSPAALNELYNSVVAGIAMSFTNVSLIAEEMLAAGAIAVVNDSPLARADLPNRHAAWAAATPSAFADTLSTLVTAPDIASRAAAASAAVRLGRWSPGQRAFVQALETEVYAR